MNQWNNNIIFDSYSSNRYAQKYRVNETDYRTLSKVFGLRFVVVITGKGGQFNIVNLFVAIGKLIKI